MKTRKQQHAMRLMAFARLPITKADLARDAAEFREAQQRAAKCGDRAHELLNAPECNPDPAIVAAWSKDFEVKYDR